MAFTGDHRVLAPAPRDLVQGCQQVLELGDIEQPFHLLGLAGTGRLGELLNLLAVVKEKRQVVLREALPEELLGVLVGQVAWCLTQ
jgi:hypothetical protein